MVVLDTSVVAKWFLEEEGSERAVKIRDDFLKGGQPIVLCDLTLYELGNLLRFKDFASGEIADALGSLFDLGVDIVVPTKNILSIAAEIAEKHELTFYDASFIALAQELQFKLKTADQKIFEKTKTLGFIELL
jgi:predicted nucleic acid-binding protein